MVNSTKVEKYSICTSFLLLIYSIANFYAKSKVKTPKNRNKMLKNPIIIEKFDISTIFP